MAPSAVYTCTEYRQEMLLLALRRQLAQDKVDDKKRRELREKIRQLEIEMGME
jgi:hypothetical protein